MSKILTPRYAPGDGPLGPYVVVKYLGRCAPQNNSGNSDHVYLCRCTHCGYERECTQHEIARTARTIPGEQPCSQCKFRIPIVLDGVSKLRGEWLAKIKREHGISHAYAVRKLTWMMATGTYHLRDLVVDGKYKNITEITPEKVKASRTRTKPQLTPIERLAFCRRWE